MASPREASAQSEVPCCVEVSIPAARETCCPSPGEGAARKRVARSVKPIPPVARNDPCPVMIPSHLRWVSCLSPVLQEVCQPVGL